MKKKRGGGLDDAINRLLEKVSPGELAAIRRRVINLMGEQLRNWLTMYAIDNDGAQPTTIAELQEWLTRRARE